MYSGESYLVKNALKHINCETVSPETIQAHIFWMVQRGVLQHSRGQICRGWVATAEEKLASMIAERMKQPVKRFKVDLAAQLAGVEEMLEIQLTGEQKTAVLSAVTNRISIVTGGPGTGKTAIQKAILQLIRKINPFSKVLCCAPTGKAARLMERSTGEPASTIHRALGLVADEDGKFGEPEKLGDVNYVLVDEASMVDMNLFHALLLAVPAGARLVMVGDVNQLPSVGPGCVLQDLIESGSFHTIMLRHIFRQASESDIVMNAHRILEGTSLPMDNKSRDFFFRERDQVPVIYKHTVQLIRQMLPGYVGCRPEDIQVLTPMRRGNLGVARLNEVLQSVLNPPAAGKREHEDHDTVFREGDKVMQTRNNYSIEWEIRGNFGMPVEQGTGIFNGDFGRIMEIDLGRKVMTVCFDDARMVEYQFSDLEDLDLAYAITVHKSQGSEYPAVILPLLSGPSGLFNRNLLYTAVTRARKCVVMLGSRGAVDRMIANTQRTHRYTGLRERILEMGDGKDGGFS